MCKTKMETQKRKEAEENGMTISKKWKKVVFAMACERNCMGHYYMNELFFSVIKA